MHGEVRGAGDFRKTSGSMALGLASAFAVMVLLLALVAKTMGWQWFNAANNAYWGGTGDAPVSIFPYPVMFAGWLVGSPVFQSALIILASLSFFGWSASLFNASTRIIFAAAFDRVLPSWAAKVSPRRGVPVGALALVAVPSVVVSIVYAYVEGFRVYLFDATVVLAVTFLGTAVAAALLPWRARRAYEKASVARYRVLGMPLITVAAVIYGGMLVFSLVLWLKDPVYGVNSKSSLIYMGALYLLALAIFLTSKFIRSRQGVDLSRSYDEIPVE
jgi:amino acid transporter